MHLGTFMFRTSTSLCQMAGFSCGRFQPFNGGCPASSGMDKPQISEFLSKTNLISAWLVKAVAANWWRYFPTSCWYYYTYYTSYWQLGTECAYQSVNMIWPNEHLDTKCFRGCLIINQGALGSCALSGSATIEWRASSKKVPPHSAEFTVVAVSPVSDWGELQRTGLKLVVSQGGSNAESRWTDSRELSAERYGNLSGGSAEWGCGV